MSLLFKSSEGALREAAREWGQAMLMEHFVKFHTATRTGSEKSGQYLLWTGPQRLCDFCVAEASGLRVPDLTYPEALHALEPTADEFVRFVTVGGQRAPAKADLWAMLKQLKRPHERDPQLRLSW